MALPNISNEQKQIVNYIKTDNNVIVDSVAGSGKTTTILYIATENTNKKILLLTYNSKLKIETREKVIDLGLNNIEVHSYHSFGVKYYDNKCYIDQGIKNVTDKNKIMKIFNYDLIILDESQDLTPIYFKFIKKIYFDNLTTQCQICLFGDKYQSIYAFNNADERFMIYAKKIFNFNKKEWKACKLKTSFRITNQMGNFLNKIVLGYDRVNTIKNGEKVKYLICDTFGKRDNTIFMELLNYLKIYSPDNIFVLAPSVKSQNSPLRLLANKLSNIGIPIYVPGSDDTKLDQEILNGKMVFSTFHQVKGLERKVVIVFNFDNSYFKYYNKNITPDKCPNEIYVAITRSSEYLTVVHHYSNNFFNFVDRYKLKSICNTLMSTKLYTNNHIENLSKEIGVTELIKYLPSHVIMKALEYFVIEKIQEKNKKINIPIKVKQGKYFEIVSDINGLAITSYYELATKGHMTILEELKKYSKIPFLPQKFNNINFLDFDSKILLELANNYSAIRSGYNYKVNQIKDYSWLEQKKLDKCFERVESQISKNAKYEVEIFDTDIIFGRKILGYIDAEDNNTIWEFKCVQNLSSEHFIQLAIYAYLKEKRNKGTIYSYKLFNILTNEIYQIHFELSNLSEMIQYLMENKFGEKKTLSDEEFINTYAY